MVTPSGRFKPNERLCLSISDYHPETWNPAWSIEKILLGLQSFMQENEVTAGSVDAPAATRAALARDSAAYNARDPTFRKVFPDEVAAFEAGRPLPPAYGGAGGGSAAAAAAAGGGAGGGGKK
jgi:ubiquitin-conjugating enzyme E2 J2